MKYSGVKVHVVRRNRKEVVFTARPRKKGLEYFPHNVDAVNDEKIEAMRALYGNDGYAFYFILLERIYRNGGVLDVQNPAIMTAIQRSITLDADLFQRMLDSAFELMLFDVHRFDQDKQLTSKAIIEKMGFVEGERERKRAYSQARRGQGVLDVQNPGETPSIRRITPPQSKGKESKYITPIAPLSGGEGVLDKSADDDQGESLPVKMAQGTDEGQVRNHSTTLDRRFTQFWTAYPRKIGKQAALKAFKRIKPDDALLASMLRAIEAQKASEQWRRDNGQYIPHPTTWLNQGRWDDVLEQNIENERWSELT